MNAEFGSLTVRTAIDAASFGYDLLYSYTVRAPLAEKIRVGMRVAVPFGMGNRRRIAMVLEGSAVPEKKLSDTVRDVISQANDVFGREKLDLTD